MMAIRRGEGGGGKKGLTQGDLLFRVMVVDVNGLTGQDVTILWQACRPVHSHYWHWLCIASLLLQTADHSCNQNTSV